jgi:histidyl-tRNA synthetase
MRIVEPPVRRPIVLVPMGEAAEIRALILSETLRDAGLVVELGYSGNVQRRMRRANRVGACAAVLIGENEIVTDMATLRDLDTGAQVHVPFDELPARLNALYGPEAA